VSVAVLHNPFAGRGRHRHAVEATLRYLSIAGYDARVLAGPTAAAALEAAREAVAEGAAALVGTGVPFGVVPAGTGNDFAVEVMVPSDPEAAAKSIAEALVAGRTRQVDLGRATGNDDCVRWFGAVLGAGFDAIVNERANTMRWPRGPRRYDLATYAELMRLRPRRYTLTLDGVVRELDVVVAGRISRTTLVRIKPRVYKGTHVEHPRVESFRVKEVRIAAIGITTYLDGERGCPLPVTVTAEPGALTLLA
jgi:diacylglycerol kinase (ATP)